MSSVENKNKKVFVGLSGGVDSSVAALLLKNSGYDVTGVFLRCFNLDGCAEYDAEDARRVAEHLGISFYTFDLYEEYKEKVVDYMIQEYRAGRTPNPDVICNREIKFGLFMEKALAMGADYIATGHYARINPVRNCKISNGVKREIPNNKSQISKNKEIYKLYAGADKNKDQSYFLWKLTQEDLKHALFPLGSYTKKEVREMAEDAGLPTAPKKDSQGICFLGKISLKDFLKEYIPEKKGDIVSLDGEKIGEHEGVNYYTIGERHVGVDNPKTSAGGETKPQYVVDKDIKTNTLVMAEGKDNPALFKDEVKLSDVNFISPESRSKSNELRVKARIRYRQPLFDAVLYKSGDNFKLKFDEPVKSIALGQSAAVYTEDEEILGGGVII